MAKFLAGKGDEGKFWEDYYRRVKELQRQRWIDALTGGDIVPLVDMGDLRIFIPAKELELAKA